MTSARTSGARMHRPAHPACPAFSKKSLPRMQLYACTFSHATAAPANLCLHASAPTHAVVRVVPANAHLVLAGAPSCLLMRMQVETAMPAGSAFASVCFLRLLRLQHESTSAT
jgi:hypothetical protein